jgi:hypothetical protein
MQLELSGYPLEDLAARSFDQAALELGESLGQRLAAFESIRGAVLDSAEQRGTGSRSKVQGSASEAHLGLTMVE